jgi:hypothetical protein
MRTTLSLDPDVAALLKRIQAKRKTSFKEVVNDALREGLQRLERPDPVKPYRTKPMHLGKCYFPNVDNVAEILEEVEGPGWL